MESSDIDWKKLEEEAERAIKKSSYHIDFALKPIKECIYIKNYVEIELNTTQDLLAVIILLIALGGSFFPTVPIYGLFVLLISGLTFKFIYKRFYNNCRKIILDAEKRILSDGSTESNLPQETPQKQENTPYRSENRAKIERIKADLDLLKIAISAVFVTMFGFGAYYLKSIPDSITSWVPLAVLTIGLCILGCEYKKIADKLKDLP